MALLHFYPAYYWPATAATFRSSLTLLRCGLGATVTINSTTKTLADFEPATTIADQKDFITATATGSKTDEAAGVALTFGHRLSQIEIKAKNTNDGYVYKVRACVSDSRFRRRRSISELPPGSWDR